MPVGAGGWGYRALVLLHVTCAVGGFGGLLYRSLVMDLVRRRASAAAAGAISVYGEVARIAEVLVYASGIFGLAAVAAGPAGAGYGRPWVIAAIAIYVAMVGILHGVVRPAEKRYRLTMLELAQAPAMAPPARPPQLPELDNLYKRAGAGMGLFNVLFLVALYLMVFKP